MNLNDSIKNFVALAYWSEQSKQQKNQSKKQVLLSMC